MESGRSKSAVSGDRGNPRRARLLVYPNPWDDESADAVVLGRLQADLAELDMEVLRLVKPGGAVEVEAASEFVADEGPQPTVVTYGGQTEPGRGGAQKIAFQYAIANGFDFVAVLWGNEAAAARDLPVLLVPLLSDAADAAFGSGSVQTDMVRRRRPRHGLFGGGRLASLRTRILGVSLSDLHSGCRLYSVRALQATRFQFNSNGPQFDVEIVMQLRANGARIVELPVPIHHGHSDRLLSDLQLTWTVVAATARRKAQRLGLLYDPKYEPKSTANTDNSRYESKLTFPSTHRWVVDAIPAGSTVLDIGCSEGHVARALAMKGCRIIGVDRRIPSELAAFACFLQNDLDEGLPDPEESIAYVLALDIIEHLRCPEKLAAEIHLLSSRNHDMRIVISTGNIAFFVIRLMLLFGQFNYGPRGILDLTHTRLFTFASLRRLLESYAFAIEHEVGIPVPFPL